MKPRISMITLGVKDLRKASEFYRQGLGFPQKAFDSDEVSFFVLQGTWLALHPRHLLAQDVGYSPEGGVFSGFTLAHNVATPAEVNRILEQAVASGGTLIKPAQNTYWGGYSGYFADLDGFLWEVAHNPAMWIGPEDHSER